MLQGEVPSQHVPYVIFYPMDGYNYAIQIRRSHVYIWCSEFKFFVRKNAFFMKIFRTFFLLSVQMF